jgi:hypothetical protein
MKHFPTIRIEFITIFVLIKSYFSLSDSDFVGDNIGHVRLDK